MKIKLDMWILLGVTVLLLISMIFIVLRLIDQSDMHVKSVKDIRVKYHRAGFTPEPTEAERMVEVDLGENRDCTVANYRNYEMSKNCMKMIGKMKNLHSLDLSDSTIGDDSWFRYLEGLPLQHLALSGTTVGDVAMQHIGKIDTLESLFVYDTNISGKGLAALSSLSNLRHLMANGNPLTDEDIMVLENIPSLMEVSLSGTKITDKSCDTFAKIPSLRILDIGRTRISTPGLMKLKQTALGDLRIKNANLHDEQLKVIAAFPQLRKITLDANPITDQGLAYLNESKSLSSINLNGCTQLTALGIHNFKVSRPDCRVDARKVTETGELTEF